MLREAARRFASLAVTVGVSRSEALAAVQSEWPDGLPSVAGRKEMSTNAAAPALETRALRVSYGRTWVIEDVTLAVPRGSVYALLGRNGAGKSSLIRVLLGERPSAAGSARLLGQDPWRHRASLMERVGIVPERPNAPPEMTAGALSAFCARLYRRWDAKLVEERFARFDVPRRRPFGTLSKGQKGAVMLALALGHSPELLLLDDPTLGLDVVARDAVYGEVIGDLADRGTTVFLTTHDLRAAEGVADRVAILHDGRVALEGALEAVKTEWHRPLEEIFAAVRLGFLERPGPAGGGALMSSKTLAIAARELQERWLLLAAGLALGFVPLVLPAFGVGKEAAGPIGLMVAVLLGGMAALLAGWSMLARDADDGRLGFLFAKPVSWPAIWAGKWIAAGLLAGASGLLAAIPWMAVYPPETKTSWWRAMADPEGWTYAISLVVLIVGFANFAATAFRARSKWLAVDLTLLLVALWAVRRFVAPLAMVGVFGLPGGWGFALLPAPVAVALLAASAGQLALGRTDIVRAHRALSIVFWALVFSLLVAAAGGLAWVERAGPSDLRQAPYDVRSAPDGRWTYVVGLTSRGLWDAPHLLVDSASGRYLRTDDLRDAWRPWQWGVGFSADGRFAVAWKEAKAATRLALVNLQAAPLQITDVALESSAPPNFLTAVCLSSGAETALVVQEGSASLVALPSGRTLAASTIPPGWRVAAARLLSATRARLWLARGEWGVATPVHGPAELRVIELTANVSPKTTTVPTDLPLSGAKNEIVLDDDGERLLTFERGLVLRNGADGTVIARLVENAKVDAARFLADGRIVALSREGSRRVLRTFGADGAPVKRVDLDLGFRPAAAELGPEVRPGQVVIATGTPFKKGDSVVVAVPEGRVVERLEGLRPAPTRVFAGDVRARPASRATFPPSYFVSGWFSGGGSGQLVRIDFTTGERRIVAGSGTPKGERLPGF